MIRDQPRNRGATAASRRKLLQRYALFRIMPFAVPKYERVARLIHNRDQRDFNGEKIRGIEYVHFSNGDISEKLDIR